jgi:hypothetical protein
MQSTEQLVSLHLVPWAEPYRIVEVLDVPLYPFVDLLGQLDPGDFEVCFSWETRLVSDCQATPRRCSW